MKRFNNLYNYICDIEAIMDMYDNVVFKNTKNKPKLEKFNRLYCTNIYDIKKFILLKNHRPCKYNIFLIKEPKYRIIMSQDLLDKVVNHLVAKYFLVYSFDNTLINENCATRVGKGTHYALNLFKKYYNEYKKNYNKFYVLKFDISKYFYNIDHEIAKTLISNKIKDKRVIELINSIIDSTNLDYVNETINKLKRNEIERINRLNINENQKNLIIKEINSLPIYKKGKGCPIGNMSSQIIATIYLNELDQMIKKDSKLKYVRYMDDGIIMCNDKEYLKYYIIKLEKILAKYKLVLNRKTKIYSSSEEIEFLGFRFCIINGKTIMKLTNKTKRRFKKKLKKKTNDYKNGIISFEEYRSVRDSYIGHLSHGNCNKLMYNIINIYYI